MKRQVALLLSLVLVFLLVGCASQNSSEASSQESAASSGDESSAVSENAGKTSDGADKADASTPATNSASTEMYRAYLEKAEEYRAKYGACTEEDRDEHIGLTGLCLAQLIDFEGDGLDDLLLVYHDKSLASEGDFFNPDAYRVEVWSWRDDALAQTQQMWAGATQATSSYILIRENGKGFEFVSDESDDGGLMYYYNLSISQNPSAGDRYWEGAADVSYSLEQVQAITEETLANLGAAS